MASWLQNLSLRWKIMIVAVMGVVMVSALAGAALKFVLEQYQLAERLQIEDAARAKTLLLLSSRIADNHARIYELLRTAETNVDEGQFYDASKPSLRNIHRIETLLKEEASVFGKTSKGNERYTELILKVAEYRVSVTNAVLMATVDFKLAGTVMAKSTTKFNDLNSRFLALNKWVQTQSSERWNRLKSEIERKSYLFALIFAAIISINIIFSYALSRYLSRDIHKHISTLGNIVSRYRFKDSDAPSSDNELATLEFVVEGVNAQYVLLKDTVSKLNTTNRQLLQSQSELSDQNERFNAALDNMPAGLCMYDHVRRLVVCNENFGKMYGVEPRLLKPGTTMQEVMEQRVAVGVYAGSSPEAYIQDRVKWVTRRQPGSTTEELNDGRVIQITQQPMSGGGWLTIHEDITERRKAQAELVRHRDRLQELVDDATRELKVKASELKQALEKEQSLNEQQKHFISVASHEFRTPLSVIDGSVQRLLRQKDSLTTEVLEKRAKRIRSAVKTMAALMESTLSAARMDAGKAELDIVDCDIRGIVAEVCDRQRELDDRYNIVCDLHELPDRIRGDRMSLEQVFTNLLSNAVKYSPDGPDIQVTGRTMDEEITISVRDRGLGIDEAELPNMFSRFFRASTSSGIPGTGIGLNLVRTLVELHDGTINVESEKGEGTTFLVRLPVAGPSARKPEDFKVA